MNDNAKRREKLSYNKSKKFKNKLITEYKVKNNCELLDFLYQNINIKSKNNIKTILKTNCVAVNGSAVTQFNYKLIPGDSVYVSKHPFEKGGKKSLFSVTLHGDIIYEDDEFIVINKPFGLLSIASDKEKIETAYRYMMDYVKLENKFNRVYVVHRLDKETSGILIFVKNEKLKNLLQDNWNTLVKKRGYVAIVEGKLDKKEDTLKNYLKMNKENLMYVTKDKTDSQLAITKYKVIKENDKFSLLDIEILTGRKNQIRVQLGNINHYVLGDDKYGNPSDPINRLALHSYEVSLIHPINKKIYTFKTKVKIPVSFNSLFKNN